MTSKTRVMVIGYERSSIEQLSKTLHGAGYLVSSFISSGNDAFLNLKEKEMDLLIINVQEPFREDSLKLAAQAWFLKNIPVVIVSAFPDEIFFDQAKKTGTFGFITAPCKAYNLKAVIDIAHEKSVTEKELKKYRNIVENANEAIYLIAGDTFEYVNSAFESLTGIITGELIKNKIAIQDFVVPEDKAIISAMISAPEKSYSKGIWLEFKIMTRYKEIKTVESMVRTLKFGQETKLMGMMRDITERKRMEEIIKLSEQYFKGVFDSANDAILIFSPENEVVIDVNPQACKMYGLTRDEFEGISLEKISKNISHGKLQIEETIKKGIFHDFETVQYRKDGSEIFLEINASVLNINGKKAILSINRDITERKRLEQELQTSLKKAGNSLEGFIRAISVILEKKDPHTSGHHRRVANLSYAIAKRLGLSEDQAEGIKTAALVHDIGKIDIPVEILTKPSKLNDYEFNIIKAHPRAAYEILKNIDFPWRIAEIVYQHHEKFNGSGYPIGLRGDDIMLEARILMVANVVEALTAPRAYRPSLGLEKALEELTLNREKFYDPKVVYACLYLFNQEDYKLE